MIQLSFDFDVMATLKNPIMVTFNKVNSYAENMDLKLTTNPDIILKFYGKSFLNGWLKVRDSIKFNNL